MPAPDSHAQADAHADTLIVRLADYVHPFEPAALFEGRAPAGLELELGSGDGGFMLEWARLHPRTAFLAVERLLGRLRKLDRKARRTGLANLRLLRIEAGYLMKYLVPPACLDALHLYFPDPWPKRRHWKHRLVNPDFADSAWRALKPSGIVYLRTDNGDYYGQMTEVFGAHRGFLAVATPASLMEVRTDFERDFHAQGVATLYGAYRKTSCPDT